MKLAGKVAVVTGAASGIGAACAQLFAREGALVALVDIDQGHLDATVDEIASSGGTAMPVVADVSDSKAVKAGAAKVLQAWGHIDVLLTCSAISTGGRVDTIDEASWDRTFAINVKGTYLWAHAVLPGMLERRSGAIVLMSSQLVASSGGNSAAYIASKGAIATLAKTMAVDYAREGIRVNALMPGVIDTPMSRRSLQRFEDPEAARQKWASRHAMNRFGQVDEVAKAALFLASEDSSFTTGSWLFADGGWSAM